MHEGWVLDGGTYTLGVAVFSSDLNFIRGRDAVFFFRLHLELDCRVQEPHILTCPIKSSCGLLGGPLCLFEVTIKFDLL